MGDPITRLLELDVRHGELLDRLAELDQQINGVLTEWTKSKELFSEEPSKFEDFVRIVPEPEPERVAA